MTVIENVQMALLSHHRRLAAWWAPASRLYGDEAMALLALVGMADQAVRACGVLAYGDLKRVETRGGPRQCPATASHGRATAGWRQGAHRADGS